MKREKSTIGGCNVIRGLARMEKRLGGTTGRLGKKKTEAVCLEIQMMRPPLKNIGLAKEKRKGDGAKEATS